MISVRGYIIRPEMITADTAHHQNIPTVHAVADGHALLCLTSANQQCWVAEVIHSILSHTSRFAFPLISMGAKHIWPSVAHFPSNKYC